MAVGRVNVGGSGYRKGDYIDVADLEIPFPLIQTSHPIVVASSEQWVSISKFPRWYNYDNYVYFPYALTIGSMPKQEGGLILDKYGNVLNNILEETNNHKIYMMPNGEGYLVLYAWGNNERDNYIARYTIRGVLVWKKTFRDLGLTRDSGTSASMGMDFFSVKNGNSHIPHKQFGYDGNFIKDNTSIPHIPYSDEIKRENYKFVITNETFPNDKFSIIKYQNNVEKWTIQGWGNFVGLVDDAVVIYAPLRTGDDKSHLIYYSIANGTRIKAIDDPTLEKEKIIFVSDTKDEKMLTSSTSFYQRKIRILN